MPEPFDSFKDFYTYYLREHTDSKCRRMHFAGTLLVIVMTITAIATTLWFLLALPVLGYGRRF